MDLKKINMGKIRDFSRNSPILFSYGFTLLVVLLNQTFSSLLYLLLPHTLWMDILYQVLFILWPAALVLIFTRIFRDKKKKQSTPPPTNSIKK